MTNSKGRVYISYAQADRLYAEALMRALEERGRDVWIDRKIESGSDWDAEIQNALRNTSAVVLIVSGDSLASQYVNYEIGSAIAAHTPVIPVLVGDVASLPIHLRRIPAIDARGLDIASMGSVVAAAIKEILGGEHDS